MKDWKTLWEKENAGYQHFLLSLNFFFKNLPKSHLKSDVWYTVKPVFRDHLREVMKVVSYSRWSLNAGYIRLI